VYCAEPVVGETVSDAYAFDPDCTEEIDEDECFCDAHYTGRHRLAEELLEAMAEIERLKAEVERWKKVNDDWVIAWGKAWGSTFENLRPGAEDKP
jgi:hypothetical protein